MKDEGTYKMKTYQIISREELYIATVEAANDLNAIYALYDKITNSYPGKGIITNLNAENLQSYVLLGRSEGPSFFEHLRADEVQ